VTIRHSVLFPSGYPLLKRIVLILPTLTPVTIVTPPNTAWVRAAVGGAGGFKDNAAGWGGGAAYAFTEEASSVASSPTFTIQVGDSQFCRPSANTIAGDSWVKRSNGTALVYADRGRPDGTPGMVANSTGAIMRGGTAAASTHGGASGGDAGDTFDLGFGGRGASSSVSAYYGGGGGFELGHDFPTFPAADGRAVLEFYSRNPDPPPPPPPPTAVDDGSVDMSDEVFSGLDYLLGWL
jgi:hypothetical protein